MFVREPAAPPCNLISAAGPLFTGILVGIGGNWLLALVILAVAGVLGAGCWFLVHPERPLRAAGVLVRRTQS